MTKRNEWKIQNKKQKYEMNNVNFLQLKSTNAMEQASSATY